MGIAVTVGVDGLDEDDLTGCDPTVGGVGRAGERRQRRGVGSADRCRPIVGAGRLAVGSTAAAGDDGDADQRRQEQGSRPRPQDFFLVIRRPSSIRGPDPDFSA